MPLVGQVAVAYSAAAAAAVPAAAGTTIAAAAIGLLVFDQLGEDSHGVSEHFDLCCHGCDLRVFDLLRFVHIGC